MMDNRIEGSRHLGYLPESGPLYYEMTPASMLDFFADARGLTANKKSERIEVFATPFTLPVIRSCTSGACWAMPGRVPIEPKRRWM